MSLNSPSSLDAVDLERPELLPSELRARLSELDQRFKREDFMETLREEPEVWRVIKQLDIFCRERGVIGIHYTRADPEDLRSTGLRVRTGAQIRSEFLDRFGDRFTPEEIGELKALWQRHQETQADIRDSRLYFNFTRSAFPGSGSEYLLRWYGGEQVHMGINERSTIARKLEQIGDPLILRCALQPSDVRTFLDCPWGQILMSSYHRSMNPEAQWVDQDGMQVSPVPPDSIEIVEVAPGVI